MDEDEVKIFTIKYHGETWVEAHNEEEAKMLFFEDMGGATDIIDSVIEDAEV